MSEQKELVNIVCKLWKDKHPDMKVTPHIVNGSLITEDAKHLYSKEELKTQIHKKLYTCQVCHGTYSHDSRRLPTE